MPSLAPTIWFPATDRVTLGGGSSDSLEPFQHRLRVESLIGIELRHHLRRIDPRLAQKRERVDRKRIA